MTAEKGIPAGMDPTEMWRQWYETGTKVWSDMARGSQESAMDPSGMYRQWFDGLQKMQEQMTGAATGSPQAGGVQEMWQRWFEITTDAWRKSAEMGQNMTDIAPRWMRMLEEARDNMMAGGTPPLDPLQFATQWYNATNGPFSDFVGDLIEREEFLEPSSQFLQNYASFYKVFKRNSEEYLKNLQIPVRSDITRVATLVVNLEDKVDHIEEVLEDLEDGRSETPDALAAVDKRIAKLQSALDKVTKTGAEAATAAFLSSVEERIGGLESVLERVTKTGAEAATADSMRTLEGRLDGVENKLDRLLAALEDNAQNGGAQNLQEVAGTNGSTASSEIKATDAARRKARETGVDLAAIDGTGADGQITVDDVRKKGDS